MHIGKLIKQALHGKGIKQEDFAKKLGISRNHLLTLMGKDDFGDNHAAKALELLGIDLQNFADENILSVLGEPVPTYANKGNLTLVPLKAFGGFLTAYENKEFINNLEHSNFPLVKGVCFAFEVEGFAMSPELNPADYIVCTELPDYNWLNKNKIYVFQTADQLLMQYFDRIQDGMCYVYNHNADLSPTEPIPLHHIKRIYHKEYVIKK